jgi:DNA/RNA-binding domain of Phe-tRNA-synthetase-like protein
VTEPPALSPAEGFIEPGLREEFPGLRLQWLTVDARRRDTPPALVRRLRDLASRYRGAGVVAMRTQPVPAAYRAFFRHIGLDPDVRRIPSENAAVVRLMHGGFRSTDLIADACLVALIETGVPVWALDADRLDAEGPGIRTASPDDASELASRGRWIEPHTLVVADRTRVHALLFEDPVDGHGVTPRTRRVALFSVGVDGVPAIHLEEALWICTSLLERQNRD